MSKPLLDSNGDNIPEYILRTFYKKHKTVGTLCTLLGMCSYPQKPKFISDLPYHTELKESDIENWVKYFRDME